jgi:branched-chain amino acid transport system permease protein
VGFAIVLSTAMSIIWGNSSRALDKPFEASRIRIGDAVLTTFDLVVVGLSLAVYAAVLLFLQRSRPGRQMRAAAESPLLASQSGMDINRIFRLSWGIAGVTMAVGGIGFAYLTLVTPSIVDLGLRGIAPALIAGLDDVRGVIVGAFAIAALENVAAYYLGGEVRNVVPFIAILVVLMIRPYGLFGSPEIRRV